MSSLAAVAAGVTWALTREREWSGLWLPGASVSCTLFAAGLWVVNVVVERATRAAHTKLVEPLIERARLTRKDLFGSFAALLHDVQVVLGVEDAVWPSDVDQLVQADLSWSVRSGATVDFDRLPSLSPQSSKDEYRADCRRLHEGVARLVAWYGQILRPEDFPLLEAFNEHITQLENLGEWETLPAQMDEQLEITRELRAERYGIGSNYYDLFHKLWPDLNTG